MPLPLLLDVKFALCWVFSNRSVSLTDPPYPLQIDLLFARLALQAVPDNLTLGDVELLKNLDYKCVKSLNGKKMTLQCFQRKILWDIGFVNTADFSGS